MRDLKRNKVKNTPGLATRKTGVTSEESIKQGECQTNVKSYESSTVKLGAPSPSEDCTEKKACVWSRARF